MRVALESERHLVVEFEDCGELDAEYEANLKARGLALATSIAIPVRAAIRVTLRLTSQGEIVVPATVVALFPGGLALSVDADPDHLVAALKTPVSFAPATAIPPAGPENIPEASIWDRLRALPHTEKLLLASKADRSERVILIQDGDPQVLLFLLKNPRITLDEVARIAKSSYLSFQGADLIGKTPQWLNSDVRVALVTNPRTPIPLAVRLLPTLPPNEIKNLARGSATSPALRQAALRLVLTM